MLILRYWTALFIFSSSLIGEALARPNIPSTVAECRASKATVGSCALVRGRLGFYSGTPAYRIWIVGTNRLLGLSEPFDLDDDQFQSIPSSVRGLMEHDPIRTVVFGDFNVCPLAREKPGAMQTVCIAAADHLIAAKWDGSPIVSQSQR